MYVIKVFALVFLLEDLIDLKKELPVFPSCPGKLKGCLV
jgi:hypothetical protein